MSTTTPTALQIPGTVTATFNPDGSVASIDFTPSASAAGYFGSHFIDEDTGEGYRAASLAEPQPDHGEVDFVSETWHVVAEYLGNNDGKIGWTE
jgi:hypothetical protein